MNRKLLFGLGGFVLVLAIAGGAFYGGMVFQRTLSTSARTNFFAGRGGDAGGAVGGGGGGFFGVGGGAGGRGGTAGQIKSIDGNVITLSTPQSEIKVTLTDQTLIQKLVEGATSDLAVGETIVVRGEADSSGNVTANSVQVGRPVQAPTP